MAIVRQNDKRSGITYVYESTSYWGQGEAAEPLSSEAYWPS